MDDAQLRTIWQQKRPYDTTAALAGPLSILMKHKLAKRVKQLGQLGAIWDEVIPDQLREHTALESFNRGTLTVMVDSASHRFQIQSVLNNGLTAEIRTRFSGALNRIKLIPGQFYSIDVETGAKRYNL